MCSVYRTCKGLIETKVKRQVLVSGHEGAEMIMRVDDILKSAPRQRAPDRCM